MATEYVQTIGSGAGTIGMDINAILAAQTLPIIENATKFYQCGEKLKNADGTGKIWSAIRYLKVKLPAVKLTEGTTPDGTSMTTETVTGTAEQWGQYISLSDVGQLTLAHPVLQKANELLGEAAAEVMDREIQEVLESATNIFYASGTSRLTLSAFTGVSTGVLNTNGVSRAVAALRMKGAKPFDGQNYIGVIDPNVEMDIILEAKFLNAAQYSNITPLLKGEIGSWMGVRWVRSNFVRTYYGAGLQVANTGSGASGQWVSGSNYVAQCVGYDPTYRLKMSISYPVNLSGGTTGTMATGGMAITFPDDPTGYLWDAYINVSGSAPARCVGVSGTGRTGGAIQAFSYIGTGAAVPGAVVTGETVHNVWIFGKGAFGVTEITGLQRTLTDGKASDSDALGQRRKTGYKLFFKPIILEDDFMAKIEVMSAAD